MLISRESEEIKSSIGQSDLTLLDSLFRGNHNMDGMTAQTLLAAVTWIPLPKEKAAGQQHNVGIARLINYLGFSNEALRRVEDLRLSTMAYSVRLSQLKESPSTVLCTVLDSVKNSVVHVTAACDDSNKRGQRNAQVQG